MNAFKRFSLLLLSSFMMMSCYWQTENQTQLSLSFAGDAHFNQQVAQSRLSSDTRVQSRALVSDAYPSLSKILLSISTNKYSTAQINSDFNDNKFTLNSTGTMIVLTNTEFSLTVPSDSPLTVKIEAINLDGFKVFSGVTTVSAENLAAEAVAVEVAMEVDLDTSIPVLTSQTQCLDSDQDGFCDLYEALFLNAQGVADIDQDGIDNKLDLDSDNDGFADGPMLDSHFPSNGGYPFFVSRNQAPQVDDVSLVTGEFVATKLQLRSAQIDGDKNDAHQITLFTPPEIGEVTIVPIAASLNSSASAANNGEAEFYRDFEITYQPPMFYVGEASFVLQMRDIAGASNQFTVTVTMIDNPQTSNTAPQLSPLDFALAADTLPFVGTLLAVDADGDTQFTFTLNDAVTQGSVELQSDGTFSFDGDFSYLAKDATTTVSFAAMVADSLGAQSSVQNYEITITGVNEPPVASNLTFVTDQNTDLDGLLFTGISDLDNPSGISAISISQNLAVGDGVVQINGVSNFDFIVGNDFKALAQGQNRVVSFRYQVSDEHQAISNEAVVDITVNGVNDVPIISHQSFELTEDAPLVNQILQQAIDPDAGAVFSDYQIIANPSLGQLSLNNGQFNFDPLGFFQSLADGQSQVVNFSYSLADELGARSNVTTVSLTVKGVNDAPTVADQGAVVGANQNLSNEVLTLASDVDSGASIVSYNLVNDVPKGLLTLNSGSFNYATNGAFAALAKDQTELVTFSYTVTDDVGAVSNTAQVSILVNGANDAPTVVNQSYSVGENATIMAQALTAPVDVDNAASILSHNLVTSPAKGLLSFNNGSFSFNPNGEFESLAVGQSENVVFSYTVTDEHSAVSNTATVTIKIDGANDAPVLAAEGFTYNEDDSIVGEALLAPTDPDSGATFSNYTVVGDVAKGVLTLNSDGTFDFDTNGEFESLAVGQSEVVTFSYTVTDEQGVLSNSANVAITVNGVNDAPVITASTASIDENSDLTSELLPIPVDVDAGASIVSFNLVSNTPAGKGSVTLNNGEFNFTTSGEFDYLPSGGSEVVSFTYTVTDDQDAISNVVQVDITITGANDAPMIAAEGFTFNEDDSIVAETLLAPTDPDNGANFSNYTLITDVSKGVLTLNNDGTFDFDTNGEFESLAVGESEVVSFVYELEDEFAAKSNQSNVTITINGVNDAPVISSSLAVNITELSHRLFDPAAVINDVDNGASVKITSANMNTGTGVVRVSPKGTWLFYHDASSGGGSAIIDYTVEDEQGATASGQVNVTVLVDEDYDGYELYGTDLDPNYNVESQADFDYDNYKDTHERVVGSDENDSLSFPAGTDISADISNDTIWGLAGSPYRISDATMINVLNSQLVIEAGVVVKFGNNSQLNVGSGSSLAVLGAKAVGYGFQEVVFTHLLDGSIQGDDSRGATEGAWAGVVLNQALPSLISGLKIDFAQISLDAIDTDVTINAYQSNDYSAMGLRFQTSAAAHQLELNDATLKSVSGVATHNMQINGAQSSATISDLTSEGASTGLVVNDALVTIDKSSVLKSSGCGIEVNTDQLFIVKFSNISINQQGLCINNAADKSQIYHNHIFDNESIAAGVNGAGIAMNDSDGDSLLIANNLIRGNVAYQGEGGGIYIAANANAQLSGNTIVENIAALNSDAGAGIKVAGTSGVISLLDSIVFNNRNYFATPVTNDVSDLSAVMSISTSLIATDPAFSNAWYLIQGQSPALDSGSVLMSSLSADHALFALTSATTDANATADTGTIDIGVHYFAKATDWDLTNSSVSPIFDSQSPLDISSGQQYVTLYLNDTAGNAMPIQQRVELDLSSLSEPSDLGVYGLGAASSVHSLVKVYDQQKQGEYQIGFKWLGSNPCPGTMQVPVYVNGQLFTTIWLQYYEPGQCG